MSNLQLRQLLKLAAHKRSWILQAIKRFGDYYYRKYNNTEVVQLIREIIERYDLNRDHDMKDRIYLVSPHFVEEKVKKIFDLPGEIGFTSRLGLVTGLREQELLYIKEKPVCNDGHGYDCENLTLPFHSKVNIYQRVFDKYGVIKQANLFYCVINNSIINNFLKSCVPDILHTHWTNTTMKLHPTITIDWK